MPKYLAVAIKDNSVIAWSEDALTLEEIIEWAEEHDADDYRYAKKQEKLEEILEEEGIEG